MNKTSLLTKSNLRKNRGTSVGLFLLMMIATCLIGISLLIFLDCYPSANREAKKLNGGDGYLSISGNLEGLTDEKITELVKDDTAGQLWARYYDLEKGEPFVCDRDGIPRKSIEELSKDRRNGYAWYNDRPAELYDKYRKWSAKWGTDPMVSLTE
jgi:hypothetical protein